ncbi:MAG: enoyl-CoA hydratase-related protein [Candidatus Binataceae bacterium]
MANVVYTVEDSVAIIRLERPEKLNAFTFGMIAEIRKAADAAASDQSVVGIIVTGAGRGFCAGLDTGDLARSAAGTAEDAGASAADDDGELPALFGYLLRIPKPVIAAINGVAAGGGFVLAMMCDLRFAATEASFTTAFSKRGLIAEHGTSWILPRLVGLNRALDLLWSARRIDAAEALRIGFVDRIVPGASLIDEAKAYIRDLAANVSPRSLAVIKAQIYSHLGLALEPALRDADRLMREALVHPDATEGVKSFVERRAPRFERLKGGKI